MANTKPHWGEWQPLVDAAEQSDAYLRVLLFMAATKVAGNTGIKIEEAAQYIKTAILDTLDKVAFAYAEQESGAIRRNIAAAEPSPC